MIHRPQPLRAALALGLALLAAGPAGAQTTAPGPHYALPSWDMTLPSATRFIVLSNLGSMAVLDRETGLVWERSPDGDGRRWQQAQSHCNNRVVGGRKGWRVPQAQELASLVDPGVAAPGPTLPPGHPFLGVGTIYWTVTASTQVGPGSWVVDFFGGLVGAMGNDNLQSVWCVRGSSGADVQ